MAEEKWEADEFKIILAKANTVIISCGMLQSDLKHFYPSLLF